MTLAELIKQLHAKSEELRKLAETDPTVKTVIDPKGYEPVKKMLNRTLKAYQQLTANTQVAPPNTQTTPTTTPQTAKVEEEADEFAEEEEPEDVHTVTVDTYANKDEDDEKAEAYEAQEKKKEEAAKKREEEAQKREEELSKLSPEDRKKREDDEAEDSRKAARNAEHELAPHMEEEKEPEEELEKPNTDPRLQLKGSVKVKDNGDVEIEGGVAYGDVAGVNTTVTLKKDGGKEVEADFEVLGAGAGVVVEYDADGKQIKKGATGKAGNVSGKYVVGPDGKPVEAEAKYENEKTGLSGEFKYDEKAISAAISKKYTIIDSTKAVTKNIPICPLVALKFSAGMEATFKASGKNEFDKEKFRAAVEASLEVILRGELFFDAAVVEAGVALEVSANAKAAGALTFTKASYTPTVSFSGANGTIAAALKFFVRLGQTLRDVYTSFGGDDKDLGYEFAWGQMDLLVFTTPSYKKGAWEGEWSFDIAPALKAKIAELEEKVAWFKTLVDMLKAVAQFISNVIGAIGEFLSACWDALVEATKDTYNWLTMSGDEYEALQQKKRREVLKNETFKKAVVEAIEMVKKNKDSIARVHKASDKKAELIKIATAHPLVQKVWHQLFKSDNVRAAEHTIDQIAAKSDLKLVAPAKAVFGSEITLSIISVSDRTFSAGKLTAGLRLKGTERVVYKLTREMNISQSVKTIPFVFTIPSAAKLVNEKLFTKEELASSKTQWEAFFFMDIEGVEKDQKGSAPIALTPPPNPIKESKPVKVQDLDYKIEAASGAFIIGSGKLITVNVAIDTPDFSTWGKGVNGLLDAVLPSAIWVAIYSGNQLVLLQETPVTLKSGFRHPYTIKLPVPTLEECAKFGFTPNIWEQWVEQKKDPKWTVRMGPIIAGFQAPTIARASVDIRMPGK